jgi:phage-related baseplate assembly protein
MNDNGGLHYIDYDSETIWNEMMMVYDMEGGDILYPGDEKEMLLRAVQMIAITILAKVDNALRMDTLTYSEREFLKEYGRKRNCEYIEAQAATAPMTITMGATGYARTLPAGTLLTADGALLWETTEEIALTGYAQEVVTTIQCETAGIAGNGLRSGTEMQFMDGLEGLVSAIIGADASGGTDAEDWEVYRERIRTYGLATVTTGPSGQYESHAKAVSNQIIDVAAKNDGPGEVGIYLILEDGADQAAIFASVAEELNAYDMRPLTDHVTIYTATEKAYTLKIKVWYGTDETLEKPVADVIAEYQEWQDNTIGRTFNPDKLVAMLYQVGCERVQIEEGSSGIDGGDVEYTEIPARARCRGTIIPTIINT